MPHFLLVPVGSHGDVHPFVGIGRALRERGHRVTMITAEPVPGLLTTVTLSPPPPLHPRTRTHTHSSSESRFSMRP